MKNTPDENTILRRLHPHFGQLRLTKTMLEKSIIDANVSIRRFARLFDIDFDIMQAGDKKVVNAVFTDGIPCTVTFYKTKNRGDRRLSISGIKRRAQIGDLLAFDFVKTGARDPMMVINVTARIERRKNNDCG